MKRLCLCLIVILAFLVAFSSIGLAQGEITVISSSVVAQFPQAITFNLEAEAVTEITDIDLEYRVERLSLVPVSCRVDADFNPGQRVSASWTWNMLEAGGLPPGTVVEYRWLIDNAAGHRMETPPTTVTFDDLRYSWDSLTSDQVTLFWYQGDQAFAQQLIDAADGALGRLASDIGVSLEQPIALYIYASQQDLLGALVYPQEWTGGIAFPDYGTIAIGISPSKLEWGKRAIAHELGHLVVHQAVFGPYVDLPTWLGEGLAMDAEGELRSDLRQRLDAAIAGDRLFSVRSIASSFPAAAAEAELCYAESYSVVQFLLDSYGSDNMLELLEVFKEGSTYDDALLAVYGFDMDGLNSLWRESLGLGPQPTPTPTPGDGVEAMPASYIVLILMVALLGTLFVYLLFRLLRRRQRA